MLVRTPEANPFHYYANGSDQGYLNVLIRSLTEPKVGGVVFPTFPPAEFQQGIHGHSGEHSLREAFTYAKLCRHYIAELRGGFKQEDRLLDFGSGWGRIIRLFMPYLDLDRIIGYEPNERVAQIAREHNRYVSFVEGSASPPTIFANEAFDYFTAWSVFSHLPQHIAKAWLEEFGRIAKPGALLFITTWGIKFIDRLDADAASLAKGEAIHPYRQDVLKRAGDLAQRRADFSAGKFVFINQHPHYGDTLIPTQAMIESLPPTLMLEAADTTTCPQTVYVIRKR